MRNTAYNRRLMAFPSPYLGDHFLYHSKKQKLVT